MIRFEIDHAEVDYSVENFRYLIKLPNKDCRINVYFEPWKIRPLIRIDNHLCNYGIAELHQFDHMIEFYWATNFFDRYFHNLTQSKIDWFKKLGAENIPSKIGIDVHNHSLIHKIKHNIK